MRTEGPTPAVRRRAVFTFLAMLLVLVAAPARAQDPFHVAYTLERGGTGPARVTGRVLNQSNVDVYDVYVTAEALDGGGKVLGRGIVFVSGAIPSHGVASFSIAIPAAQNAASFRVRVSSFRHGIGQQQAG